jgi:hypothetical protein
MDYKPTDGPAPRPSVHLMTQIMLVVQPCLEVHQPRQNGLPRKKQSIAGRLIPPKSAGAVT